MTLDQIRIIRDSFARVAPRAEVAALIFYKRLFESDPALRPLFRTPIEEQGAKLMQMLAAAVRLLDKPESLVPVLQDLGRRHAGYGVKREHYGTVGSALLAMFDDLLGDQFTAEAREAWAALYAVVARTMTEAAATSLAASSASLVAQQTAAV